MASIVNQGSIVVVAYLDDFSASCLSAAELKRCVGATVCFAERWKIQLNPRKCCVVVSEHAKGWDLQELDLPREETWDFLGMSLGHGKESKRSVGRIEKAMNRVRRVKSFAGTLSMKASLVEMMVVSPCWGLSFEPGIRDRLLELCKATCVTLWGIARFAVKDAWCWAAIHTWKTNPLTHYFLEAGTLVRGIWEDEGIRPILHELWQIDSVRKDKGLWTVFCSFVRECGATRGEAGTVLWKETRVLDMSMGLSQWKHGMRFLCRIWWARRAGISDADIHRLPWKLLDHALGKPRTLRSSVASLITGTFLTGGLQCRVFGDVEGLCPHCGQWDSQLHRLAWCEGSEHLRHDARFGASDSERLLGQGAWWAARGILLRSHELWRNSSARCLGVSFLSMIGPQIWAEDENLMAETQGTYDIEAYEWKGHGTCSVVSISGSSVQLCVETTGLKKKEATWAGVLRCVIGRHMRRKTCTIRSQFLLEDFRKWLRVSDAPWGDLRKILSSSDLMWLRWEPIRNAKPPGFWDVWAERSGVLAFVGADERDATTTSRLVDMCMNQGNLWREVGRVSHQMKRRRLSVGH